MVVLNGLVKLNLIETGHDEVSYYNTEFIKEEKLSKYIDEILASKEWGEIDIYNQNDTMIYRLDYDSERIKSHPKVDINWDSIVTEAEYCGGWSYGHWALTIKEG